MGSQRKYMSAAMHPISFIVTAAIIHSSLAIFGQQPSTCRSNYDCHTRLCVSRNNVFCNIGNLFRRDQNCNHKECAQCVTRNHCGANEYCSANYCIKRQPQPSVNDYLRCQYTQDCRPDERCLSGYCLGGSNLGQCSNNRECRRSEICQNSRCITDWASYGK